LEKIGQGRLRSWSAVLPFRQAQGPEPAEGLHRFRNVCGQDEPATTAIAQTEAKNNS
jgi:hypothetical protein